MALSLKLSIPAMAWLKLLIFITGGNAPERPQVIYVDKTALTKDEVITVDPKNNNAKSVVSCGHNLARR